MRHQKFREWIPLLAYDELDEDEKYLLEQHLSVCTECREQLDEIREIQQVASSRGEPSDLLLQQARRELRISLRHQESRQRSWLAGWDWAWLVPSFRTALAGIICLVVGLAAGHFVYRPPVTDSETSVVTKPVVGVLPGSPGNISVGNIRFINADPSDGNVEFTYEATAPVHVRGNVNDPLVQDVLSEALVDAQNPGVRLRAASMLNTDKLKQPDPDVKRALITALKLDENNGVRKQALAALQNFSFDSEIRDAFLYVLNNDSNPAMRIAAIDAIRTERYRDPEILRVLKERMNTDGNEYIRYRSRAVLQEAKQR